MAKFATNDLENNTSNPIDRINSMIKEFIETQTAIKAFDYKLNYWRAPASKLLGNNWAIEARCNELQKKMSSLETMLPQNAVNDEIKKQELQTLLEIQKGKCEEQWNSIQSDITEYADNFLYSKKRYSIQSLVEDIEEYKKESQKIVEHLSMIKQELKDLEAQCDLNNPEECMGNDDLDSFNTVMTGIISRNNILSHATRSAEDALHKIQSKIKQTKMALNNRQIPKK